MTQSTSLQKINLMTMVHRFVPALIGAILLGMIAVGLLAPSPTIADTPPPPAFSGDPLLTPANAAILSITRPAFSWQPATGEVISYTLHITGSSIVTDIETINPAYTPAAGLPSGTYTWTVQAYGPGGESGFVTPRSFTIDAVPAFAGNPLLAPANQSTLTMPYPTFDWADAAGEAVRYTMRFTSPNRIVDYPVTDSQATVSLWENGAYSWSVQAENAAGENTGFVAPFDFTLDATWQVYLPFIIRSPEPECPPVSGNSYTTIPIEGITTDRPGPHHADLNLELRGWEETNQPRGLIQYSGPTDLNAPQLDGLFSPRRFDGISSVYQVYHWNWDTNSRDGLIVDDWSVFMMGLPTTPKENIYPPYRGPEIYGGGYKVMVLYAEERRITLAFTRRDTVAEGYAVHLENLCIDPNLLALYRAQTDGEGYHLPGHKKLGGYLPALKADQSLGVALDNEILVVIRDTGRFMDPRSRKDWWTQYPATLISVQVHDTSLSK
jgi:hypothetical protein